MKYGIMYKQGDILLIPIPFTDLSAYKKRPVLVISNNKYNAANQDIIVAAMTSVITRQGILINSSDLSNGTLPKTTLIRCDKIFTLNKAIVDKKIGAVSDIIMVNVIKSVIELIS